MTNKPGNWRQGVAAFYRWGLVWLSIGLFTLLTGINLLRTAFMDINRESSRRELVSYEADHPLRFLLFLAAALAVTLLLQRWWSTADTQRSRAMHAAIFLHGEFWAFGGSGTSAWSLRRVPVPAGVGRQEPVHSAILYAGAALWRGGPERDGSGAQNTDTETAQQAEQNCKSRIK